MPLKNRNLLFVCPGYPALGGVETVTAHLAEYFLKQEYRIFLLVSGLDAAPGHPLSVYQQWMTVLPEHISNEKKLEKIALFIQEHQIACVFNQGAFLPVQKLGISLKDTLFVNTLHMEPFWERQMFSFRPARYWIEKERGLFRKTLMLLRIGLFHVHPNLAFPRLRSFYRKQIARSGPYVVLDPIYKKMLENALFRGKEQSTIQVIPNPCIVPANTPSDKKKQVLFVGRLTREQKRADRLLRIWHSVQYKSDDWELIVVGDGPERPRLEKMALDLHLDRIRFEGFQPADPYYMEASILCLTSTIEGWPMVIREAQSWGVVPMGFDSVKSLKSQINDGKDGCVIPAFDEALYAEKLLELMLSDERRKKMGEQARLKALETTPEKVGEKWLKLLEQ